MAWPRRRDPDYQPPPDPGAGVWEDSLVRWMIHQFCVHPAELAARDRVTLLRNLRRGRESGVPIERVLGLLEPLFLLLLGPGTDRHARAVAHQQWRREQRRNGRRRAGS